jgi:tRNA(Ile)-lysidine synthase TilS/MesJ
VYEDITRQIRFSFYSAFKCPVILGHNLDDCFENVFQNLSKQIHFENLFGMKPQSSEQGVPILRPMLEIPKKEILLFADYMDIPHLYDSTPSWSRRGQMRDILIPGIQTFDSHILPGLQEFVKRSIFLEQQWLDSFQEFYTKVQYSQDKKSYTLPRNSFFQTNSGSLNFWITLWHTLGTTTSRPSNKSFLNLIQQLNTRAQVCGLNLEWKVFIGSDKITVVRI